LVEYFFALDEPLSFLCRTIAMKERPVCRYEQTVENVD
jgi:hypothetical protein